MCITVIILTFTQSHRWLYIIYMQVMQVLCVQYATKLYELMCTDFKNDMLVDEGDFAVTNQVIFLWYSTISFLKFIARFMDTICVLLCFGIYSYSSISSTHVKVSSLAPGQPYHLPPICRSFFANLFQISWFVSLIEWRIICICYPKI